jgi:hypothetical protein
MADNTKSKRLSKGERTHRRRLKQAARKSGGAAAIQLLRAQRGGEVKKEKGHSTTPSPANPPMDVPQS